MAVELIDLVAIEPADVSNDDLVLMWDIAAPSGNAKKATRAQFLAGVAMEETDVVFGDVDADALNAPVGAIDELTVATGLIIGATIEKVLTASASLSVADILAYDDGTATMTVTGAVSGDVVILALPAGMPAGMIVRGDVTAANTVTVRIYNATAATITAASYTVRALVIRVV